jgi:hypothetical protein
MAMADAARRARDERARDSRREVDELQATLAAVASSLTPPPGTHPV